MIFRSDGKGFPEDAELRIFYETNLIVYLHNFYFDMTQEAGGSSGKPRRQRHARRRHGGQRVGRTAQEKPEDFSQSD